jgi:hypothetical protein
MTDHPATPAEAEAWIRFMAAALSAGPHVPVETLAVRSDDALAEYRKRCAAGGLLGRASPGPA